MKLLYYFFLLLSVCSLSACQPRMYFPERVNTAGFQQAGEFKATFSGRPQGQDTGSGTLRGGSFSPDVDIAYSVTDHFAVLTSYRSVLNHYIKERTLASYPILPDFNTFGGMFNGSYGEIGAGYYSAYGRKGRVEVFGGYGTGNIKRTSLKTNQYDYSAKYNRFFIQPALGFSNDIFSLMGGFKVTFQKFNSFQSPNEDLRYFISTTSGTAPSKDVTAEVYTFFQPYIDMGIGYKYVRFNTQLGFSKEITGGYISGTLPVYITFGATFNYAPRYFNKRPGRVIDNKEN